MTNSEIARLYASLPPDETAEVMMITDGLDGVERLVLSSPNAGTELIEDGLLDEDDSHLPIIFA